MPKEEPENRNQKGLVSSLNKLFEYFIYFYLFLFFKNKMSELWLLLILNFQIHLCFSQLQCKLPAAWYWPEIFSYFYLCQLVLH